MRKFQLEKNLRPSLVLLSREYSGPDVLHAYSLDPISGAEDNCNATVTLSREAFDAIFRTGDDIPKGYADDFAAGLGSAMGYQKWSREFSEAFDASIAFLKSQGHEGSMKDVFPFFWKHFEETYVLPRLIKPRHNRPGADE